MVERCEPRQYWIYPGSQGKKCSSDPRHLTEDSCGVLCNADENPLAEGGLASSRWVVVVLGLSREPNRHTLRDRPWHQTLVVLQPCCVAQSTGFQLFPPRDWKEILLRTLMDTIIVPTSLAVSLVPLDGPMLRSILLIYFILKP